MTISDIVIIVIVACAALMGFIKGMKKSLSSMTKFFISLIGAFFLTKIVANILLDVDFVARSIVGGNSLFSFLRSLLPSRLDFVSSSAIKEQVEGVSSAQALENVRALLVENGLSGFFMSIGFILFGHALTNPQYLNSSLPTATDIVALELSYALFCAIIFILVFFSFRIVLAILGKIFKSNNERKKRFTLRLASIFIGALRGACYTFLLFCLLSLLSVCSFMSSVNADISASKIAHPLLNSAATITSKIIESPAKDSRYEKLIEIADYSK